MRSLRECIRDFDVTALKYLNPQRINHWVRFFQIVSDTTSQIAYGLPVLILLTGLLRRRRDVALRGLLALISVFVADYTALFVKNHFNRVRPFDAIAGILPYSDAGNASFPSGHTTQAMAMAASVALLFPRPGVAVPVLAWAFLVGWGRVYLGVHYPSDVIGAMLLSAIVAPLVFLLGKRTLLKRVR